MSNLETIYYQYNHKEISTPTSEGYLTDFQKNQDWIKWLKKEFYIGEDEWEAERWKIKFKSKNQPEYTELFYTDEKATQKGWDMEENEKEAGMIYFPPIYLHPLVEDYLLSHCEDCGHQTKYSIRKMKEYLKGRSEEDSWIMVSCKGCGIIGSIDKDCVYRICYQHMGKGRQFWIEAWKKLGVIKLENHV